MQHITKYGVGINPYSIKQRDACLVKEEYNNVECSSALNLDNIYDSFNSTCKGQQKCILINNGRDLAGIAEAALGFDILKNSVETTFYRKTAKINQKNRCGNFQS